jgi:hypothetical protein
MAFSCQVGTTVAAALRDVLAAKYIDDATLEEVAAAGETTVEAVKSLLRLRTIDLLRTLFRSELVWVHGAADFREHTVRNCQVEKFGHTADVELAHDAGAPHFDCAHGNEQLRRHQYVGIAGENQLQRFGLARSQSRDLPVHARKLLVVRAPLFVQCQRLFNAAEQGRPLAWLF